MPDPSPEHPVRQETLNAGRSPGLRISGRLPHRLPTFPARVPVASGDLSGHGRGGGCALGVEFRPLSHSLFTCQITGTSPVDMRCTGQ